MSADTLFGPATPVERGTELRHRPSGSTVTVIDVTHETNPFDETRETWVDCRFSDGRTYDFQWPHEFGSILVPTDE
jgi:hypothetical protein